MIRVLVDTNVLASGFVNLTSPPGQALMHWTYGRFRLLYSEHILSELADTLADPYFRQRLPPAQIEADLALLRREGWLIQVPEHIGRIASHPEDDLVIAAAIAGEADFPVTGDRGLLALGTVHGVRIVSPRDFLDALLSDPGVGATQDKG
jgi:putative PIN family toxin of toxin-antitoxin system